LQYENYLLEGEIIVVKKLITRRDVLTWTTSWGLTVFVGGGVVNIGRFMVPKVLYEPSETIIAGFPEDFPEGTVDTRLIKDYKVWVIHHGEPITKKKGIYSLIAVCTHLGCTPRWNQEELLFQCGCHGSVFDVEGNNISGPAPSPLWRAPIRMTPDGRIEVGVGILNVGRPQQAQLMPKREDKQHLLKL
jgi:Rieske Fe-S protein|tara:strand:- start:142932 stop:143498 length:567 start_codon:yes stop_codon:yes gene_type:complete